MFILGKSFVLISEWNLHTISITRSSPKNFLSLLQAQAENVKSFCPKNKSHLIFSVNSWINYDEKNIFQRCLKIFVNCNIFFIFFYYIRSTRPTRKERQTRQERWSRRWRNSRKFYYQNHNRKLFSSDYVTNRAQRIFQKFLI